MTGLSPLGSKNTFAAWQTTNAEPRFPIFALQCYSLLICYHGNIIIIIMQADFLSASYVGFLCRFRATISYGIKHSAAGESLLFCHLIKKHSC